MYAWIYMGAEVVISHLSVCPRTHPGCRCTDVMQMPGENDGQAAAMSPEGGSIKFCDARDEAGKASIGFVHGHIRRVHALQGPAVKGNCSRQIRAGCRLRPEALWAGTALRTCAASAIGFTSVHS